jgi:hypothetical protein
MQLPALAADTMQPWSLHPGSLEKDFAHLEIHHFVLEQVLLIQKVRNQKEVDRRITFQLLAPVVHTRFELVAGMRQSRVAADIQNLLVAPERVLGKVLLLQKAQNQKVLDLQIAFRPDSMLVLVHTYSELIVRT